MRADRSRTRGHTVCPMNNKTSVSTSAVAFAQPVNHTQPQPQPATRTLKVALDVHLLQHVVAMQYDGSTPKPTQRFSPKSFLARCPHPSHPMNFRSGGALAPGLERRKLPPVIRMSRPAPSAP